MRNVVLIDGMLKKSFYWRSGLRPVQLWELKLEVGDASVSFVVGGIGIEWGGALGCGVVAMVAVSVKASFA